MLARSHTDVAGFGEMSISYLKDNMGISNFGILSPNDAYGQGFQKVRVVLSTFPSFFCNGVFTHHHMMCLLYSPCLRQRRGEI